VLVARGSRAILYCDGNEVVDAETGGISVPVAIADGGTGATTAGAALINLGSIFRSTGRIAESLDAFKEVLQTQPKLDRAWLNLGLVLLQTRRWPEAVDAFEHAVQLSPGLPLAHYNLAVARQQLGDYGPALEALTAALALDPNFVEAHLCMGNIRKDQGRLVEALACFSRAVALRPDYHPAHSNMLFTTAFMDDMTPAQIFDLHCGWARLGETTGC
jgi:protein O-GlcNAc transferase